MGAQKGLKRATLKFTKTQLPAVLEARKKNKHMKIKAKQAVQTKANLQVKGAERACAERESLRASARLRASTPDAALVRSRRAAAAPAALRRKRAARGATPHGVHCVCVLLRRVARAASCALTRAASPALRRAAADAAAAAEAKKRRAADIGVDEFLDGAFKELGSASEDESGEDDAAAASDASDSDEARAPRGLPMHAAGGPATSHYICIAHLRAIATAALIWAQARNPDGCSACAGRCARRRRR